MRRPIRYVLVTGGTLAAWALTAVAHCQEQPPKRAILVAVNGYADPKHHPRGTGLEELNTAPDVDRLRKVLKTRWNFRDNEITVLKTPAETTHVAIVNTFKRVFLDPTLKGKGAVLFFHYSGHGSQWPDKTDKTELDQTLVPSDYKSKNDGSNDITDKEIAGLLAKLTDNKPASVFLSFDSCHSGTITRGGVSGKERGFKRQLPPTIGKSRGMESPGDLVSQSDAARWGYTVISACRSDQSDSEIMDGKLAMGSLSYALCRALSDATATTTYQDIFNRVQSVMLDKVPCQDPLIEGAAAQVLFSDKIEKPDATIGVYTHDREARILAGSLMGIAPGTELALYPKDTRKIEGAKPIGTATVGASVASTEAGIVPHLAPGTPFTALENARAVITRRRYTGQPVRLDLSAIAGHPRAADLRAALEPMLKEGMIAFTTPGKEDWDVRLAPPTGAFGKVKVAFKQEGGDSSAWDVTIPSATTRGDSQASSTGTAHLRGGDPLAPGSLILQAHDGAFLTVQIGATTRYAQILDNDAALIRDVKERLHRFAMARMLRTLKTQVGESFIKVEIQIVPCKVKMVSGATGKPHAEYDGDLPLATTGGAARFQVGDYFYIKRRNTGGQTAYLTVLDLSDDGSLAALWPDPNWRALQTATTEVPADQTWRPLTDPRFGGKIAIYHFTEPLGKETIWAVATQKQTDFGPILSPKTRGTTTGPAHGAEDSPFGRMLRSNQDGKRSKGEEFDPGDFALLDYTFTIVPTAKP